MTLHPTSDEIAHRLCQVLVPFANGSVAGPEEIQRTTAVFGPSGIITDSLDVLDALCQVEVEFDLSIPDEDLTEDLFASVGNFSSYLSGRLVDTEGS